MTYTSRRAELRRQWTADNKSRWSRHEPTIRWRDWTPSAEVEVTTEAESE